MNNRRRNRSRSQRTLHRVMDVPFALLVALTVALYVIAGGMHVGAPTPIPGVVAGLAGVAVFHTVLRSVRAMSDWIDRKIDEHSEDAS